MPKLPGSGADLPEKRMSDIGNNIPVVIDGQLFIKTEREALEIADQILMLIISRKQDDRKYNNGKV